MSAGNFMTMNDSARFAFISAGDRMFMDDLMFADDRMSMGESANGQYLEVLFVFSLNPLAPRGRPLVCWQVTSNSG